MLEHVYYLEDEDSSAIESPHRREPEEHMHSEVVRPRERTIRIEDGPNKDSEEEYMRRREHHRRSRRREDPWTPLAVELKEVPWPHRFKCDNLATI
jgi:hypothetical protein